MLKKAIAEMQRGDLTQALTIATCIRVLVHETGSSKPLLKRLRTDYLALPISDWIRGQKNAGDKREIAVIDLPICAKISDNDPKISLGHDLAFKPMCTCSLGNWWNEPFAIIPGPTSLTRREVILGLANKEGAHVDAEVSDKYGRLIDNQFLGITVNNVNLGPLNISRLLAGGCGMQIVDCLHKHFPVFA